MVPADRSTTRTVGIALPAPDAPVLVATDQPGWTGGGSGAAWRDSPSSHSRNTRTFELSIAERG
jgi:hypothetical protein